MLPTWQSLCPRMSWRLVRWLVLCTLDFLHSRQLHNTRWLLGIDLHTATGRGGCQKGPVQLVCSKSATADSPSTAVQHHDSSPDSIVVAGVAEDPHLVACSGGCDCVIRLVWHCYHWWSAGGLSGSNNSGDAWARRLGVWVTGHVLRSTCATCAAVVLQLSVAC